jgi:hypothetical protein
VEIWYYSDGAYSVFNYFCFMSLVFFLLMVPVSHATSTNPYWKEEQTFQIKGETRKAQMKLTVRRVCIRY